MKLRTIADEPRQIEPLAVSIPDAGNILSVGRTTIFSLIAKRELRSIQVGRRRLVLRESIVEYVARKADEQALRRPNLVETEGCVSNCFVQNAKTVQIDQNYADNGEDLL